MTKVTKLNGKLSNRQKLSRCFDSFIPIPVCQSFSSVCHAVYLSFETSRNYPGTEFRSAAAKLEKKKSKFSAVCSRSL